jgi:uncharacterized SAM-binding protein YcdF (DUF218 family)
MLTPDGSMAMVGLNSEAGMETGRPSNKPPRTAGGMLRRIAWSIAAIPVLAMLVLLVGFVWFIWHVPAKEIVLDRDADGIVVLTGGASRIPDAIELLAAGRGRRLLISGVNRSTNRSEISRLNPQFAPVVRCCVDFDRSLNTLGNAVETRRWTESKGFHSLIVVTSNYHMPRALIEIGHQLPDVPLVPFPVVTDKLRTESWWANMATTRLLLLEYVKYVFANVRIWLNLGSNEEAQTRASGNS